MTGAAAEGVRSANVVSALVRVTFELMRSGMHLGLGLAAMAFDSVSSVADEAVRRGALVEERGVESVASFERETVAMMKTYIRRTRSRNGDSPIEATVEHALATLEVASRDEAREVRVHFSALSRQIGR